ncbi:hypothetical protein [Sphingomonas sp.]|jgi:hypothetical protein|uniref:hypothetical protein n=1 Tax=Sphingomonas sp. TaxID=28214 RepID=UPI0035C81BE9
MKFDVAGDPSLAVQGVRRDAAPAGRRDPATAMAQGIVVGAAGGLALWALVGAVVVSVF